MDWSSTLPPFPASSFNFDFSLTGFFAQTPNERCPPPPQRARTHHHHHNRLTPRSPRRNKGSTTVAQYKFCPPVTLERSYSCPVKRTIRLSTAQSTKTDPTELDLSLGLVPKGLPVASEVNTPDEEFVTAFDLGLKIAGTGGMEETKIEKNKTEKIAEKMEKETVVEKLDVVMEEEEMKEVRIEDIADEESGETLSAESKTSTTTSETPKKRTVDEIADDPSSPLQPKPKYRKPNTAEENEILIKLLDEENKTWAEVMKEFEERGWGDRKIKLLKARYKAYKEGSVFWEGDDVDILTQAHWKAEREFEDKRWDYVSERMVTMGSSMKFPPWACERKFKERVKKKEDDLEKAAKEKIEKAEREKAEEEKAAAEKDKVGFGIGEKDSDDAVNDDKTDVVAMPEPKRRNRRAKVPKDDVESTDAITTTPRKGKGKAKVKSKTRAKVKGAAGEPHE